MERSTAKRGDSVALKISFTGMSLTGDLDANVTHDVKALRRGGSVYDSL